MQINGVSEAKLKTYPLGQTGIHVSRLGLGTVKFGRNAGVKYPHGFDLPSDKVISELLFLAESAGINLLDTAPAYGASETRLGKALVGMRKRWVIATKVGELFVNGESYFDFSAKGMIASVENSLRCLNTDYLDIVLIHSNGDDMHLIQNEAVFVTLSDLKRAGKILSFGMSTKTVAGGMATIDYADVAMVTHHPLYTQEQEVIIHAEKNKKGIFIKKAFASGHLHQFKSHDPIADNLAFILKEKGVSSVIAGTINPVHLQQMVDCVSQLGW